MVRAFHNLDIIRKIMIHCQNEYQERSKNIKDNYDKTAIYLSYDDKREYFETYYLDLYTYLNCRNCLD